VSWARLYGHERPDPPAILRELLDEDRRLYAHLGWDEIWRDDVRYCVRGLPDASAEWWTEVLLSQEATWRAAYELRSERQAVGGAR
jgi:hypothetical protein